jgi:hypothetical protein
LPGCSSAEPPAIVAGAQLQHAVALRQLEPEVLRAGVAGGVGDDLLRASQYRQRRARVAQQQRLRRSWNASERA